MNRYKNITLGIVRRWEEPSLIDYYPALAPDKPWLLTVCGYTGSGKTTLAGILAKRLRQLGASTPAIIDTEASQALMCHFNNKDRFHILPNNIFRVLHEMLLARAVDVRGPVIITADATRPAVRREILRRGYGGGIAGFADIVEGETPRINAHAMHLSDGVWVTDRRSNEFLVTCVKNRLASPDSHPKLFVPSLAHFEESSPYLAEGYRIVRNIRRLL